MVYLCGTKYDLVEENKKLRKVEYSTVKEYSDGRLAVAGSIFNEMVY